MLSSRSAPLPCHIFKAELMIAMRLIAVFGIVFCLVVLAYSFSKSGNPNNEVQTNPVELGQQLTGDQTNSN